MGMPADLHSMGIVRRGICQDLKIRAIGLDCANIEICHVHPPRENDA